MYEPEIWGIVHPTSPPITFPWKSGNGAIQVNEFPSFTKFAVCWPLPHLK